MADAVKNPGLAESGALPGPAGADPTPRSGWWLLVILTAWLFALRLLGPSNLTDNDQERPAAYVLDALRNGHWMAQHDWTGDFASKPPLYTWLAAAIGWLTGGPSLLALYLPCALAVFGTAALLHGPMRRHLGPRTALIAAFFFLANPLTAKLVALARTDAVFTFTVALTAWLAFESWQRGGHWIRPWLAASLATLTKGPLGLLLGFGGLVAWLRERRFGARPPTGRGHLAGAALLVLLSGGWLFLAWRAYGDAVFDKLIRSELVGHVVHRAGPTPGAGLILTPLYFLGRFAPWSVLVISGLWSAFRTPLVEPGARRLQAFAAAWLLVGFVVLGLASHQRGDLIAPLMPAGAILAAIPVARWLSRWSPRRLLGTLAVVGLGLGIGCQLQHASRSKDSFAETRGMAELARTYLETGGRPDRLLHVDTPYALQWNLGTMQPAETVESAGRRLHQEIGIAVAVSDRSRLAAALGPDTAHLRTIAVWPIGPNPRAQIVVLER